MTLHLSPQCQTVLRHIKRAGSISPFEAIMDYGITRLSARILDLKEFGYEFITQIKTNPVTKKRYARYSLKGGDPTAQNR